MQDALRTGISPDCTVVANISVPEQIHSWLGSNGIEWRGLGSANVSSQVLSAASG